MDVSRRRAGVKTSVVAGSVWESRMKLDEVKGGIKVNNGDNEDSNNNEENSSSPSSRKLVKRSPISSNASRRKTWKSDSLDSPIQIIGKSSIKSSEDQLSVSLDGGIMKRSSLRKGGRSDLSASVDGIDKSLLLGKKGRSVDMSSDEKHSRKGIVRSDVKEVVENGTTQLRKNQSDCVSSGIEKNSVELKKVESESEKESSVIKGSGNDDDDSVTKKNPPPMDENGSDDSCKEFGICQEKVISSTETNVDPSELVNDKIQDDDGDIKDEEDDDEMEDEIESDKNSIDIMEVVAVKEARPKINVEVKASSPPSPPPTRTPVKTSINNKKVEFSTPPEQPKKVNRVNNEENKRVYSFRNRAAPPTPSTTVINNKQTAPVLKRAAAYQSYSKPNSIPVNTNNACRNFPQRPNKLQNIVDLVMWRDISRSAFAFGIGTFIIISSSYTKDLNVSFISVMSYLGLVYLAIIFLYRTLINRGVIDIEDTSYVVGEEEAIWLLKLVLPYLNECLLKIRALFSGDPATTMKMAVLLFVFARCGTSITIWKMAKLGFFGVFTVPKVCSSYSTQLTAYAKFWIRRFRDAWDSCTHKKAVALAIFTLVWNLSSMVARVWAVFMMYVAVRYYQQTMELDDGEEDWVVEEETLNGQKQGTNTNNNTAEVNKLKKWS